MPPPGNLAHNPGMCPDWESNQRPFGSQAGAQSTEPHQPGLFSNTDFLISVSNLISLARTPETILNNNGNHRHPYFIFNLKGTKYGDYGLGFFLQH